MQSIIKYTHIYDDSESIYLIQIIVDMESAIWNMVIKSSLPIFHHLIVNPVCIVNIKISRSKCPQNPPREARTLFVDIINVLVKITV